MIAERFGRRLIALLLAGAVGLPAGGQVRPNKGPAPKAPPAPAEAGGDERGAARPDSATFSGTFAKHAVAADHPLASQAGAEILAIGGNAVDAAVATSFALSVVRPFSCGIGGGGFMVIHLRQHPRMKIGVDGFRTTFNYRESCPAGVGPDYFEKLDEQASTIGAKAVATPGSVAGLLRALSAYGTMERSAVLAPAIALARGGFIVDEAYAKAAAEVIEKFEKNPAWKARFAFIWQRLLNEGRVAKGDRIKLPEQAEALELIARDGAAAFYEGPIAEAILKATRSDGGALSAEDLKAYQPVEQEPLVFNFDGRTFLTMNLPSSGGVAMAQTLGLLERVKIAEVAKERGGFAAPVMALTAEAFKHAYADRARWLGDAQSAAQNVPKILAPANLDAIAKRVKIGRTGPSESYGTKLPGAAGAGKDDAGTSHLCVIDAQGNAVSCTETINLEFGSLLAVPEFGFVLNNEMDDFAARAGKPNAFGLTQGASNRPGPGKRPLSSMSPTIVLGRKGAEPVKAELVAGASGGPRIISATTQVVMMALLLDMPADQAVAHGRIHHQWSPNLLEVEANIDERWEGLAVRDWMRKLGHQLAKEPKHAAVQLIKRTPKGLQAASDPRKGGAPAGG